MCIRNDEAQPADGGQELKSVAMKSKHKNFKYH